MRYSLELLFTPKTSLSFSLRLFLFWLVLLLQVPTLTHAQDTLALRKLINKLDKANPQKKPPLVEWNRDFIRTIGAEIDKIEAPFLIRWIKDLQMSQTKDLDLMYDEIEQNINLSFVPSVYAKLLLLKAYCALDNSTEDEFQSKLKRLYKYCDNNDLALEKSDGRNLEGSYWFGKGNFEKASEIFLLNVPVQERLKDTAGLIKSYINLGSCQNYRGYHNIALRFFQLGSNLIDRYPPSFEMKLLVENNIGAVLMELKDNQATLRHFQQLEKRIETLKKPDHNEQLLVVQLNKALIYTRLGLSKEAIKAREKINELKPYWNVYSRYVKLVNFDICITLSDETGAKSWLEEIDKMFLEGEEGLNAELLSTHKKYREKFGHWVMSPKLRAIWQKQIIKENNLRYNTESVEAAALLAKDENRLADALKWTDSLASYTFQNSEEKLNLINNEFNLQNKERLFLDSLSSMKVNYNRVEAQANFLGNIVFWIVIASFLIVLNLAFLYLLSKRKQKSLALESQLERQKAENLELKNRFLSERVEKRQIESSLSENRDEYYQEFKQHLLEALGLMDEIRLALINSDLEVRNKVRNKEQQIRNLLIVLNHNESQLKQAESWNNNSQNWIEHLGPVWLEMAETEKEIIRLVREGFTNKEIAGKLGKSQMYIEKLRSKVRKRFNISKEQDLQQYLLSLGSEK